MANEKPGNGGIFPPEQHRFTSTNQPTPQAKSEGRLRWASRKRIIEDIYTELIGDVLFKNGKKMPALQAMIHKLQNFLLGSKNENFTDKQATVFLKLLDLLIPKENNADLFTESVVTSYPKEFADFCEAAGYPRPFPKQIEMAELVRGDGPRLLLGSRGYGKTDYGVTCNIPYCLLDDPSDTWLILTKEKDRGQEVLSEISRILK